MSPHILFLADHGAAIGGGHVMRCLTLTQALMERGVRVSFTTTAGGLELIDHYGSDAQSIGHFLTPATDPQTLLDTLKSEPVELLGQVDGLVFDHYGLSAPHHHALTAGLTAALNQARPPRTFALEDLANRPMGCDVVIDLGPDRLASDYAPFCARPTQFCLGPSHALVRPVFATLRAESLVRHALQQGPARNILVSLGLTDVGGITARVISRILPRLPVDTTPCELHVVVGAAAPSLMVLKALARNEPRLKLHINTPHMAQLMADADLMIGAGGSTLWERCTLGTPSLLLVLADNQIPPARAVASRGATEMLDVRDPQFDAQFDRQFLRLSRDGLIRRGLSEQSALLCDGQGADRLAQIILDQTVPS